MSGMLETVAAERAASTPCILRCGGTMYFAYFDESGDNGRVDQGSPTRTFTLACILVHDKRWLTALDKTAEWRRSVKRDFRIPVTAELKSNWLIHNKSNAIRDAKLSLEERINVFRSAMRFLRDAAPIFRVFAVLIVKYRIELAHVDARDKAWEWALQRLERFGRDRAENIHVIPDEGHGQFIRKKIRKMRRFNRVRSAFGPGTLSRLVDNIVEDPSDRQSHESFFIQLADLAAYSAYRRVVAGKHFGKEIWDTVGDVLIDEVDAVRGVGPRGIVVWPAKRKPSKK
jgi:hypothetical protein